MSHSVTTFGIGLLVGGLTISSCWGLFWLTIGTVGLIRRTCSWRVILNSLAVGVIPLLMIAGLMWLPNEGQGFGAAFGAGLLVMPLVLAGVGLRRAPDGRPAWIHMVDGVRRLMDELLGRHHACTGCGEAHCTSKPL